MNVAYFLIPKGNVAYLYEDYTLRQGLEKMRAHGYTAIPVLTRDNRYAGTVSEGDFLWYLVGGKLNTDPVQIQLPEGREAQVADIMRPGRNPPVSITATIEELLARAENQNFIPVIDDRRCLRPRRRRTSSAITRRDGGPRQSGKRSWLKRRGVNPESRFTGRGFGMRSDVCG